MIVDTFDMQTANNGELRKRIRVLEARLKTLSAHLGQMGPYMQDLMRDHMLILTVAHTQQKKLHLAVLGIGPAALMDVRRTLAKVCKLSADHAAEYKKMTDPLVNTNHLVALQIKAKEAEAAEGKELPDAGTN